MTKANASPQALSLQELTERYGQVQLATLASKTPPGEWSYELKYDGYRVLAIKSQREVRLWSRNGRDSTAEFGEIERAVRTLRASSFVIDGEVCAIDSSGLPSFQLLQNRGRSRAPLMFFAFDLLELDGKDLRSRSLEHRRRALEMLVQRPAVKGVSLSKAVEGMDEATVLAAVCRAGFEGVVAKEVGSTYEPGRSHTWLKLKCIKRQEFAVVGWLPYKDTPGAVGALALAVADTGGTLTYAGKVGTGFDAQSRTMLAKLLTPIESAHSTAVGLPRFGGVIHHVEPRYVVEVAFTAWTDGGHIRHPSFKGLRKDKSPFECVREEAAPSPPPPRRGADKPRSFKAARRADAPRDAPSAPRR